jgi:hypothetical protein
MLSSCEVQVFVLVRTEEFEKLLVCLDADRATCKAFHLVYYRGKGSSLTKVDVSK